MACIFVNEKGPELFLWSQEKGTKTEVQTRLELEEAA
jgi:hypothetical protein